MSFPPGPFSVNMFVFDSHLGAQYVTTFSSRSSADVFWRALQQAPDNPTTTLCHRYHSRYIYRPFQLPPSVLAREELRGMSTVQVPPEATVVLQGEQNPDNVNGGSFYVRSPIRKNVFWYYDPSAEQVKTSTTHQTRFIIRRVNNLAVAPTHPDEDILIGSDDVRISVWLDKEEREQGIVATNEKSGGSLGNLIGDWRNSAGLGGGMRWRENPTGVFKFHCFDGGFRVRNTVPGEGGHVYLGSGPKGQPKAERWEFVD